MFTEVRSRKEGIWRVLCAVRAGMMSGILGGAISDRGVWMTKDLDAVDRKIVALVAANGRISHEDIARRVFVSRPAVHERVKRLEHDGVIRGYRAVVDWAAIDLGLCGFVSIQIEHEHMSEVLSKLFEISNPQALIEECHRITGQWCVLLKVRAASPQALQELLDQIHAVSGVTQLLTSIVLTSLDA